MYRKWDNRAVSILNADVRPVPGNTKLRSWLIYRWYHTDLWLSMWLHFLEASILHMTAEQLLLISWMCLSQEGWGSCALDVCSSTLTFMCDLFPPERPVNADQQERTLLTGVFSVRKGKTQLHKWAERQVILCGTCLIVASVKDSLTGKMHILPLVGGKVRDQSVEVRQPERVFAFPEGRAHTPGLV